MWPVEIVLLIVLLGVALTALGLGLSRASQRRERRALDTEAAPRSPRPPAPSRPVASPVEDREQVVDDLDAELAELQRELGDVDVVEDTEAVVEPVRLRDRLGRTRAAFAKLGLRGRGRLDEATWDELEELLILADVGVATTQRILDNLRARARADRVGDGDALLAALHDELRAVFEDRERGLLRLPGEPNVWMFVGVNGVGKTTTIAKVAQRQVADGRRVVLAAADTFRAAAADQLEHWAERTGAAIVRGQEGADPGSVVFDAMSSAASRDVELVLVDTAGRLHTKVNLMAELEKLRRIVDRTPGALKEVLLVLDATTGQNGLAQARQFAEAVDVTGVVLTKLDGTAKGGIVLAIEAELGIPVKLVGVGESSDDLLDFDPDAFVAALLE